MVTFRVSIRKQFGEVSIEDEDENNIINNLKRLQSFEKGVAEALGFDIEIPDSVIKKLPTLHYGERILVLLSYASRPLGRQDCKLRTKLLQIPEGWGIGSNFSKDLNQLPDGSIEKVQDHEVTKYKITNKGRNLVKVLLSDKASTGDDMS